MEAWAAAAALASQLVGAGGFDSNSGNATNGGNVHEHFPELAILAVRKTKGKDTHSNSNKNNASGKTICLPLREACAPFGDKRGLPFGCVATGMRQTCGRSCCFHRLGARP